jgi:Protein of unknown function (DUF3570)
VIAPPHPGLLRACARLGAAWFAALTLVALAREANAQTLTPPPPPPSQTSNLDVHVASEFASYADTDHVFVQTPSIAGAVSNPLAGWSVDGSYLVDVVSAASVDIVSTASQRWQEVRQAGTLGATYKPNDFGVSAASAVSVEPDFLSWMIGGSLTEDFLQKNLTLLLGFYHSHDTAGRTGTPFSVFSETLDSEALKLGLTRVVNRTTTLSFIVDAIFEDGNQAKPYRYIPLFTPGTVVPIGASIDLVNSLRVNDRPIEQLPLSRQRYALTTRLAHRFHRATLRLDERLYGDSWLLFASTTDARYLFDLGRRVETGPHARLHVQNGVDFWQRAYTLEPGFNFPEYRTGDRELGPLIDITGGWSLKIGLGPTADPTRWILGFDANFTSTRFLDDLYLTERAAGLLGISLEANL